MSNILFVLSFFPVDTVPPEVIFCPPDQSLVIELGNELPTVTWQDPFATDLSEVTVFSQSSQSGTQFRIGTTDVTYNFRDTSGNSAVCSFSITVETGNN